MTKRLKLKMIALVIFGALFIFACTVKHKLEYNHPVEIGFPKKAETLLGDGYQKEFVDQGAVYIHEDKNYKLQRVFVLDMGSTAWDKFNINGHEVIILGNRDLCKVDGHLYTLTE